MRIKVTGYLDTDDMESDEVDLGHPMGLSNKGYEHYSMNLGLDDVTFTAIEAVPGE
jgi:hypothetical protein